MKKKSLLATCLLISLSVHLFFLFFFARTPLLLQSKLSSLFRKSAPSLELLTAEEDELLRQAELEEVFESLTTTPTPFDFYHQPSGNTKSPAQEGIASLPSVLEEQVLALQNVEESPSILSTPSFLTEFESATALEEVNSSEEFVSQIKFDKVPSSDHKKAISSSLALDEVETIDDLGINSLTVSALPESKLPAVNVIESFVKSPELEKPISSSPTPPSDILSIEPLAESDPLILASPLSPSGDLQKPFTFQNPKSLPATDNYQLPAVASAMPWDSAFDVKIELMANPDGKGVVFSMNLAPSEAIDAEAMTHNFYFLIDRSSSIQRHRFAAYKRAVLKALSCLHEGDKFNILLFDKKIKRLSEHPLSFSQKSCKRAEEFLESQEHGGMFAAADLYSALDKIIPYQVSEGEAHSAILITDGDSSQPPAKQQKMIAAWLAKNAGKVTLYTAAVGKENNLLMLDLLSSSSGGQLIYSDTYAAFPRKLGKLLLDLRGPLVKELTVTAQPKKEGEAIQLYPASSAMPTLFAKRPYEIIGSASSLTDFTLQIQGKYKNQWVTITKEVSLRKAVKGNRPLEKKWANVRAKSQYDNFLKEGKVAHLLKAKEILKSSGHEIAME